MAQSLPPCFYRLLTSIVSSSYGLPAYAPLKETLIRFAYNNQTGPNAAFPVEYDITCPTLTALTELVLAVS
jgi:hypothetical protein